MRITKLLALLISACFSCVSVASDAPAPVSRSEVTVTQTNTPLETCLHDSAMQSVNGEAVCYAQEVKRQDKILATKIATLSRTILNDTDSFVSLIGRKEQIQLLKKSHVHWLAYRNMWCGSVAAAIAGPGAGTVSQQCKLDHNSQRLSELSAN